MISKIRQADEELRQEVLPLYEEVRKFLRSKGFQETVMEDVRKAVPDVEEQLKTGETGLREGKCAILVAGLYIRGKGSKV